MVWSVHGYLSSDQGTQQIRVVLAHHKSDHFVQYILNFCVCTYCLDDLVDLRKRKWMSLPFLQQRQPCICWLAPRASMPSVDRNISNCTTGIPAQGRSPAVCLFCCFQWLHAGAHRWWRLNRWGPKRGLAAGPCWPVVECLATPRRGWISSHYYT